MEERFESRQQCCYSKDGSLIKSGPGAGTPDKFAAVGLYPELHIKHDVDPYEWCCKDCFLPGDKMCKNYWGHARAGNSNHCKGAASLPNERCMTPDLMFDGTLLQLAADPNQKWTASSGDGDRRKPSMQGSSGGPTPEGTWYVQKELNADFSNADFSEGLDAIGDWSLLRPCFLFFHNREAMYLRVLSSTSDESTDSRTPGITVFDPHSTFGEWLRSKNSPDFAHDFITIAVNYGNSLSKSEYVTKGNSWSFEVVGGWEDGFRLKGRSGILFEKEAPKSEEIPAQRHQSGQRKMLAVAGESDGTELRSLETARQPLLKGSIDLGKREVIFFEVETKPPIPVGPVQVGGSLMSSGSMALELGGEIGISPKAYAQVGLGPQIMAVLDVALHASLCFFVCVRAGIAIEAVLLDHELKFLVDVDLSQWPLNVSPRIDYTKHPLRISLYSYYQFKACFKCKKWSCGIRWCSRKKLLNMPIDAGKPDVSTLWDKRVADLNHLPTCIPTTFETEEDVIFKGVLPCEDKDVSKNPPDVLTYILEKGASYGSLTISDESIGSFMYVPQPDWSGEDEFGVKLHDGREYSDSYVMRIKVHARADPAWVRVVGGRGDEDSFVGISIGAQSVDDDGSERCVVVITGLKWDYVPVLVGSNIEQGLFPAVFRVGNEEMGKSAAQYHTGDLYTTSKSLSCEEVDGRMLAVSPPLHYDEDLQLKVEVQTIERSNQHTVSVTKDLGILIYAVNDGPELVGLPISLRTIEDEALTLQGMWIFDRDAQEGAVSFSAWAERGRVVARGLGAESVCRRGSVSTDIDKGSLMCNAALGRLNGAIYRLIYIPDKDFDGYDASGAESLLDSITISISDNGHSGKGGAQGNEYKVPVSVCPVNDGPSLVLPAYKDGGNGLKIIEEEQNYVSFSVEISDPDIRNRELYVTLSLEVGSGDIVLAADASRRVHIMATGSCDDRKNRPCAEFLSFRGKLPDVRYVLSRLEYRVKQSNACAHLIGIKVEDKGQFGCSISDCFDEICQNTAEILSSQPLFVSKEIPITVFRKNRPPIITANHTALLGVAQGRMHLIENKLFVKDDDATFGNFFLRLSSAKVSLEFVEVPEATGYVHEGVTYLELTANLSRVQEALSYVKLTPQAWQSGESSLDILVDDQGNTGTGGPQEASVAIRFWIEERVPPPHLRILEPYVVSPTGKWADVTFGLDARYASVSVEMVRPYYCQLLNAAYGSSSSSFPQKPSTVDCNANARNTSDSHGLIFEMRQQQSVLPGKAVVSIFSAKPIKISVLIRAIALGEESQSQHGSEGGSDRAESTESIDVVQVEWITGPVHAYEPSLEISSASSRDRVCTKKYSLDSGYDCSRCPSHCIKIGIEMRESCEVDFREGHAYFRSWLNGSNGSDVVWLESVSDFVAEASISNVSNSTDQNVSNVTFIETPAPFQIPCGIVNVSMNGLYPSPDLNHLHSLELPAGFGGGGYKELAVVAACYGILPSECRQCNCSHTSRQCSCDGLDIRIHSGPQGETLGSLSLRRHLQRARGSPASKIELSVVVDGAGLQEGCCYNKFEYAIGGMYPLIVPDRVSSEILVSPGRCSADADVICGFPNSTAVCNFGELGNVGARLTIEGKLSCPTPVVLLNRSVSITVPLAISFSYGGYVTLPDASTVSMAPTGVTFVRTSGHTQLNSMAVIERSSSEYSVVEGSELSICDLALSDPDSPDGSQMVKVTLSSRHGGEIIAPPRFSTSHSAAGPHIEIVGSLANLTSELGGCVKYRHPALFVGTDHITIALNDLETDLFGGRQILFTVTQIHVVQMLRTSVPVLNMSKMAYASRPKVWEINGYPSPSISYQRAKEMNGHRHHNCYHKNVEEGYPCVVYIPDIAIDSPHVHVDLTISTQSCASNGFADAGGHVSLPRVYGVAFHDNIISGPHVTISGPPEQINKALADLTFRSSNESSCYDYVTYDARVELELFAGSARNVTSFLYVDLPSPVTLIARGTSLVKVHGMGSLGDEMFGQWGSSGSDVGTAMPNPGVLGYEEMPSQVVRMLYAITSDCLVLVLIDGRVVKVRGIGGVGAGMFDMAQDPSGTGFRPKNESASWWLGDDKLDPFTDTTFAMAYMHPYLFLAHGGGVKHYLIKVKLAEASGPNMLAQAGVASREDLNPKQSFLHPVRMIVPLLGQNNLLLVISKGQVSTCASALSTLLKIKGAGTQSSDGKVLYYEPPQHVPDEQMDVCTDFEAQDNTVMETLRVGGALVQSMLHADGATLIGFCNGTILKVASQGARNDGRTEHAFGVTQACDNEFEPDPLTAHKSWLGVQHFDKAVTSMLYMKGATILSFSDGKVLKIKGVGSVGEGMLGVEEKWNRFEITNTSHTSWLGDHKFSEEIVSMQEGKDGWIFVRFSDEVLLKVNAENAYGSNMFRMIDHRGRDDNTNHHSPIFSGEVHVEKSETLVLIELVNDAPQLNARRRHFQIDEDFCFQESSSPGGRDSGLLHVPLASGSRFENAVITNPFLLEVDFDLDDPDAEIVAGDIEIKVRTSLNDELFVRKSLEAQFQRGRDPAKWTDFWFHAPLRDAREALNNMYYCSEPDANTNWNRGKPIALEIEVCDRAYFGDFGKLTDVVTLYVDVVPVNDAPVMKLPGKQSVLEDNILSFESDPVIVDDVDVHEDVDGRLTLTCSVNQGSLLLPCLSNAGHKPSFKTSVICIGSVQELNSALASMRYKAPESWSGTDVLTVHLSDNGFTGRGGELEDSGETLIEVIAVADKPKFKISYQPYADGLAGIDGRPLVAFENATVREALVWSSKFEDSQLKILSGTEIDFVTVQNGSQSILSSAEMIPNRVDEIVFHHNDSDGFMLYLWPEDLMQSNVLVFDFTSEIVLTTSQESGIDFYLDNVQVRPGLLITDEDTSASIYIDAFTSDTDGSEFITATLEVSPDISIGVQKHILLPEDKLLEVGDALDFCVYNDSHPDLRQRQLPPDENRQENITVVDLAIIDHGFALVAPERRQHAYLLSREQLASGIYVTGDPDYHGVSRAVLNILSTEISNGDTSFVEVTFPIKVEPRNDAPLVVFPQLPVAIEDQDSAVSGVQISDKDDRFGTGTGSRLVVTCSVSNGWLHFENISGLSFASRCQNESFCTMEGSLLALNAVLGNFTYRGFPNYNGNEILAIAINDTGFHDRSDWVSVVKKVTIHVRAVNDEPQVILVNESNLNVREGESSMLPDLRIIDPDDGSPTDIFDEDVSTSSEVNKSPLYEIMFQAHAGSLFVNSTAAELLHHNVEILVGDSGNWSSSGPLCRDVNVNVDVSNASNVSNQMCINSTEQSPWLSLRGPKESLNRILSPSIIVYVGRLGYDTNDSLVVIVNDRACCGLSFKSNGTDRPDIVWNQEQKLSPDRRLLNVVSSENVPSALDGRKRSYGNVAIKLEGKLSIPISILPVNDAPRVQVWAESVDPTTSNIRIPSRDEMKSTVEASNGSNASASLLNWTSFQDLEVESCTPLWLFLEVDDDALPFDILTVQLHCSLGTMELSKEEQTGSNTHLFATPTRHLTFAATLKNVTQLITEYTAWEAGSDNITVSINDNGNRGDGPAKTGRFTLYIRIQDRCGDSRRSAGEECDDGNTENGDGCSATCLAVEPGFECSKAACSKSVCNSICGDGKRVGNESCDDGNSNSGDGCSAACTIECGYGCGRGDAATSDRCDTKCGDGKQSGREECDDGNTAAGDGCSPNCAIEAGFSCSVRNSSSSVCGLSICGWITGNEECGDGKTLGNEITYQDFCDDGNRMGNDGCSADCTVECGYQCVDGTAKAPAVCSTICGDAIRSGSEACDDGNDVDGDGCSAHCRVEDGFTCMETADCQSSACNTVCGDGLRAGNETCDDGDTNCKDGCSAECTVECGFTCEWGTPTSYDTCTATCGDRVQAESVEECDDGNLVDGDGCSTLCKREEGWKCLGGRCNVSSCHPICGDGLQKGQEECDDGNRLAYDGCSEQCTIECGWACSGAVDNCFRMLEICGDGMRKGAEECDDNNTQSGDGCNLQCQVEPGYTCGGASNHLRCGGPVDVCEAGSCGTGRMEGKFKECDDGNTWGGDGCSGSCRIECGWQCSGRGLNATDACSAAACGDQRVAGDETCDDGNNEDGDGCSSECTKETGYSCTHLAVPPYPCGMYGDVCKPECGDGLLVGIELERGYCDDGNRIEGDGCSSSCSVECGYNCSTAQGKSLCQTVCGDKKRAGQEACDDGNNKDGDGCSANCQTIEAGWECSSPACDQSVCNECQVGKTSSSVEGGGCEECPAGTHKPTQGSGSCLPCAANSNSIAGSATCSCNTGYTAPDGGPCRVSITIFVEVVVTLDMSLDEFDDKKKQDFKQALANAAGVEASGVSIRKVEPISPTLTRRVASIESIRITARVLVSDRSTVATVTDSMTEQRVNDQLVQQGLPQVRSLDVALVEIPFSSTPPPPPLPPPPPPPPATLSTPGATTAPRVETPPPSTTPDPLSRPNPGAVAAGVFVVLWSLLLCCGVYCCRRFYLFSRDRHTKVVAEDQAV